MAITELEVFPQVTWSVGQGHVGTRKWALDHDNDIDAFVALVCNSHWPGQPDSIPIQVQSGAFWEGAQVTRSCGSPRTEETLGDLPRYNKYLVVATYALHRINNCWPVEFSKPWHPPGTTLSLRVRGAGQYLLVSPAGVRTASPLLACSEASESLSAAAGTRIIIPTPEYHVSCDRLTKDQVDACQSDYYWSGSEDEGSEVGGTTAGGTWNAHLGCVNASLFLGAYPGTLLLDGYELAETNVPDPITPQRYRLTAVFKHRSIIGEDGQPLQDENGLYIGWNHDFVNFGALSGGSGGSTAAARVARSKMWGWRYLKMYDTTSGECRPRYIDKEFTYIFGATPYMLRHCGTVTEGATALRNLCLDGSEN